MKSAMEQAAVEQAQAAGRPDPLPWAAAASAPPASPPLQPCARPSQRLPRPVHTLCDHAEASGAGIPGLYLPLRGGGVWMPRSANSTMWNGQRRHGMRKSTTEWWLQGRWQRRSGAPANWCSCADRICHSCGAGGRKLPSCVTPGSYLQSR